MYVDVPFCESICSYCIFRDSVLENKSQIDEYLKLLAKEMSQFSAIFRGQKICSLYIGGGTPSLLSIGHIKQLVEMIAARFDLEIGPENIYGIEVNPMHLSEALIDFLATSIFNKISVGIQSFDREVLAAVNRRHPPNEILLYHLGYLIASMRRKKSIVNVDMMIGLDKQTEASLKRDYELLANLTVPKIEVYPFSRRLNDNEFVKYHHAVMDSLARIMTQYEFRPAKSRASGFTSHAFLNKYTLSYFARGYSHEPRAYNNNLGFGRRADSYIIPLKFFYRKERDNFIILSDSEADQTSVGHAEMLARAANNRASKKKIFFV
jgi:coproporphyrinogen III oxidase-like Fe-S oxidoreductase